MKLAGPPAAHPRRYIECFVRKDEDKRFRCKLRVIGASEDRRIKARSALRYLIRNDLGLGET
jgi:hypothetical protein